MRRRFPPGPRKLVDELRKSHVLREVVSEAQDGGLRALVSVDRETAGRLGISMQAINDALNDAFGQRQISTIYGQANQYRVVLEAMAQYQSDPSALSRVYVPGPNGVQVPLSSVARIERRIAPLAVYRQDQFPSVTLSFNVAHGAALSDAVTAIGEAQQAIGMPTSITGNYSGDADEFAKSLSGQPWLILAAIITIYIVLGVLYESFIHPFTILTTLPSAGIGAVLALMWFGYDLSLDRADRHRSSHGHREEERHHDDRFCAGGGTHARYVAPGFHRRGRAAALSADHDDDAGGLVWSASAGHRRRHRLGAA